MSTILSALQADLKTWTELVERAIERLENHETRLSAMEHRMTTHLADAARVQQTLDAQLRGDSRPARSHDG